MIAEEFYEIALLFQITAVPRISGLGHPCRCAYAITALAIFEAIDALFGAKRDSPRVVPDETKLAITTAHRAALTDFGEQFGIVVSSGYFRSSEKRGR
ncbi:hypothetical protein [Bradyrhizobium sp. CB1015]|uniref:hypothetical protein n=1 Tax=Bradyrhizobium sp. CB1015 TaxID=2976822 RepID=UPI0021A9FDFE|nr:hypothetical protein [Bradyrhizobium sp. CB1015]UWU94307.1 hypothetical protein N2604_10885 [Bradyrhizobium sp. CB1015]